mmetsp:Transcript_2813/g.5212  ORF Transcript_2813/g.5212 Transcript_2813/m.5212 type:complete len:269 (-) Transcript_2813:553-1359(-)
MSNHIGGSKIAHDKWILARLYRFDHCRGNPLLAHFRLLVISGNFGRRNHLPFLPVVANFTASIEEKRYVCILFRLRAMELRDTFLGKPFRENIVHLLRRVQNWERERSIVLRHRKNLEVGWDLKRGLERWLDTKCFIDLPHTIASIVEEEQCVIFPNECILIDKYRFEKLVCFSRFIALLDGSYGIRGSLCSFSSDESFNGKLDSIPALVAVHRVVSANHESNLSIFHFLQAMNELLNIAIHGLWWCIPSVSKRMNKTILHASLFTLC